MKRPSISIPATKTVQPFAQQPFPHPIPVAWQHSLGHPEIGMSKR